MFVENKRFREDSLIYSITLLASVLGGCVSTIITINTIDLFWETLVLPGWRDVNYSDKDVHIQCLSAS